MKYTIETKVTNEVITQLLVDNNGDILIRWVFDTREKHVRDSLIQLGWSPPPIIKKEKDEI